LLLINTLTPELLLKTKSNLLTVEMLMRIWILKLNKLPN